MAGVIMNTRMRMVKIGDILEETRKVKSFWFTDTLGARAEPGQFVMVWVPCMASGEIDFTVPDQVPMSISRVDGERFSITVQKCGKTTEELFKYRKGDWVGITGPLGRGFTMTGDRVLCVGGGIGAAPLLLLLHYSGGKTVHFILGAQTGADLIFTEELKALCTSLHLTTDDGSAGRKGFASDPVEESCRKFDIDQIYSCGPEPMMYTVLQTALSLKIPAQFSLERYMYCGLGLCGHCSLDHYLVCKDGPVFTSEELKKVKDFGVKRVDETGRKIPF
jgi:dihydroorotate dehydrogenase electron transfer subunit